MDNYGQPMQQNFSSQSDMAGGYAGQQSGVGYQQAPVDSGLLNQNIQQNPTPTSWRDSLAEELRGNPNLTKFDSIEKLAEGYINVSRLFGRRAAEIPLDKLKQTFSPEELATFYKGMGVPEAPDQYQVQGIPEQLIDNPVVKDNLQKAQQMAHKLGISNDAFNEIVKMEFELNRNAMLQQQQSNLAELSNIYGRDLGRVEQVATNAVLKIGGEKLLNKLIASGAASDPDVFQALVKIGSTMQTDRFPNEISHGAQSPTDIKEQIRALYNDRDFYAKLKENNPLAKERMDSLYQKLHQFEQRR